MDNIHFLQNCGSIIGDEGFSSTISDHFIHASGTQTSSDTVCNCWVIQNLPLAAWMFVERMSFILSFLLYAACFGALVSDIFFSYNLNLFKIIFLKFIMHES